MIHVIIVNYRTADFTIAAIESLGDADVRICVFENGSPEPTEALRLAAYARTHSRVEVVESTTNIGFGPAVNDAVRRVAPSDSDLLWILNPDTVVSKAACDTLASHTTSQSRTIASPVILSGDDHDRVWFAGGDLDMHRGRTAHRTDRSGRDGAPFTVSFLTGAAMMMLASTWRELGGFRDDLFLYWEDADLSRRAAAAGVTLTVVPSATIWHRVGGATSSTGAKSAEWYYYMFRNRLVVCAADARGVVRVLVGPGLITTLKHVYRAVREPGARWPRAVAMVRGTVAGVVLVRRRAVA